jgi:predicted RNase H-like nuclease (RuvC/YqgF family)
MEQESLAPLIEFIGKKFDAVDRRLDQMATRDELEAKLGETRRHMGVLVEAVRDDVRQLAEGLAETNRGLAETNQRLDRFQRTVEEEFAETRAAVRFSYAQLQRRIQELEGNYASLDERVARLEARER